MASLTDSEKIEFKRLAQLTPLRQPAPPIVSFERYLTILSELSRDTATEARPPKGNQWKL